MGRDIHFKHWPPRVAKSLTVPETTLYDNLVMTAKRYPHQSAIHYYGSSITYKQLVEEVDALAGFLENELCIRKGENVLLFMQNSPQYLISFFAILRVRATVIPINPMSTVEEMDYYVKDSHVKNALVSQELFRKVKYLLEKDVLDNVIIATYSDYIGEDESLGEITKVVLEKRQEFPKTIRWKDALMNTKKPTKYEGVSTDLAIIPYTSGTTGMPKGCVHTNATSQANVIGAYHWMNMTPNAITLTTLPLFHVTGLVHSGLTPIFAGSTIVMLTRWDRDYAAKVVEKYQCSHWINISTMVIDFLANPKLGNYDISSFVLIGGGGAPLPKTVGERLLEVSGLEYVEGYGLSETMSHTHFNPPQRPKLQCLGIPAFDVDARVIDVKTGKEVDHGGEGELVVNGPQLFKGYYNKKEETEKSFIHIATKPFFKTGDIVKVDEDGYFFLIDRVKRMINAAGFKVWPTEVESILYQHPAVQQVCVVRAKDDLRGETVKALIVLKDNFKGKTTEKEIIDWSKEKLAAYKYPRIVEFMESFPMTSSGKVLWRELQDE